MSNSPFGLNGSARFQPRAVATFSEPSPAIAASRFDRMDAFVNFLFNPNGRVSRLAYRVSCTGYTVLGFFLYRVGHYMRLDLNAINVHTADHSAAYYVLAEILLLMLACLIAFSTSIIVTIKRWHDLDKSGWWVLLGFIPLLGWAAQLIVCSLVYGKLERNRFGPPPRLRRL